MHIKNNKLKLVFETERRLDIRIEDVCRDEVDGKSTRLIPILSYGDAPRG